MTWIIYLSIRNSSKQYFLFKTLDAFDPVAPSSLPNNSPRSFGPLHRTPSCSASLNSAQRPSDKTSPSYNLGNHGNKATLTSYGNNVNSASIKKSQTVTTNRFRNTADSVTSNGNTKHKTPNLQTVKKLPNMVPHMNANPFSTGDIEDTDFDVSLVDIPFCKSGDGNHGKLVIANNVTKAESLVRNSKEKGQTAPAANSLSERTTTAKTLISGLRRNSNGGENVHGVTGRSNGVSTSQDNQLHGSSVRDIAPHAGVIKKQSEMPDSILRTAASKEPIAMSFSSRIKTLNHRQPISSQAIITQKTGSTKAVHTLQGETFGASTNNTPSRISTPDGAGNGRRKRKFPGPAGALPKLVSSLTKLMIKHVI